MPRRIAALVALFALAPLYAQDKPPVPPAPPAPPAGVAAVPSVEVIFADGSIVKLNLLEAKIDVTTRYGKLAVPIGEIRKIEMGLRYPDGALAKIQDAITRLGDPDFKKREAASTELLALRELGYPHVRRATQEGNAEAQKRAKALLEELRKRVPEEKLAVKDYDSISTIDFTIAGRIEASSFKARSALLGDVDIKLYQVSAMRWSGHTTEVQLTIDAAKHGGPQESWLDSGLDLNGDKLNIQATGSVDVMPNNPGQYMAGPDGLRVDVGFRRGGAVMVGPPGALVGRVGQNGKPFLVGSKYDSTPGGDGRLYLKLEASPWNVVQSGNYTVKIATGK